MNPIQIREQFWWEREDLHYEDGRLTFSGRDLTRWIQGSDTPCFVYAAGPMRRNLENLHGALDRQGVPHRLFFAIKSNRFGPVISYLRATGLCGIDTCSPGEVQLARSIGFTEDEISFTGSSLSNSDLAYVAERPGVHFIADSISAIRRFGRLCPGREIGIRLNLSQGAGYHAGLHYAGERPTKFGIYRKQFAEALAAVKEHRLRVKTLHFHIGSGYLNAQLDNFARVLENCDWFVEQCPEVEILDVGGGLGVPLTATDQPLDLDRWAAIIAAFAHRHGLTVHVEPGDFVVKNAGLLVTEVNMVEEKQDVLFVGVNGGLNMQPLTVYYDIPAEVVPLSRREGELRRVTIVGNINESIDVLARDVLLPPLAEGDLLAFLNLGGYASTMSSNHCLRGRFQEFFLPPV